MTVQPIPEGYHTVTPYLVVEDVGKLLDFLRRAFNAEETERIEMPDGSVKHAQVAIGNSHIMMGASSGDWKPMPSCIYLYVPDMESVYKQALEAGATTIEEPTNQFYGDRSAGVQDPTGNLWWIATHFEDVSPEEIQKRAAAAFGGSG